MGSRVRASGARDVGGHRVAVLERRGKFLVAEPFFAPGPRLAVPRDTRVSVGDLVVVRAGTSRNGRRGARAKVARRIGRPNVARDVIEALMIDRGLRRAFDPAVEHEARDSAERADAFASARRDLRRLLPDAIRAAGTGSRGVADPSLIRRTIRRCRSATPPVAYLSLNSLSPAEFANLREGGVASPPIQPAPRTSNGPLADNP